MRYYEAIYIVHPNIELEGLNKILDATKEMLKKRGGELLYEEVMGKKRLAYSIQKQRFGTYVLLQFRGDGSGNARLNQDLELYDDILAHMIVRIEADEVREAREAETEISEQALSDEIDPEAEKTKEAEPETSEIDADEEIMAEDEVEEEVVEEEVVEEEVAEEEVVEEEVAVEEVAAAEKEELEPEEEK